MLFQIYLEVFQTGNQLFFFSTLGNKIRLQIQPPSKFSAAYYDQWLPTVQDSKYGAQIMTLTVLLWTKCFLFLYFSFRVCKMERGVAFTL